VEIDETTGVLKRDGVAGKINPYDLFAIETGLWVRERTGGSVTALSMGPLQAEQIIREAYAMGVDDGCLVSDRRFAGADVLATSYTLSQAIVVLGGFDLVVCGRQTTDGDTAQVGPALAEQLGIVHASGVKAISRVEPRGITVEQDLSESTQTVYLSFPCLIAVEKDILQPRLPSYKRKLATEGRPVRILTLDDLYDTDASHYGLDGSATKVERIFPPEPSRAQTVFEGGGEELSRRLFCILKAGKYI
jgi:electron transfer flavoprotein beta subunit